MITKEYRIKCTTTDKGHNRIKKLVDKLVAGERKDIHGYRHLEWYTQFLEDTKSKFNSQSNYGRSDPVGLFSEDSQI